MASPIRKFRYPVGVIPGNVEHFAGNSHESNRDASGLHHVFEVTIPIIMGVFVILFFLFTTLYLGFSLIKLYYSDTLKPYKTKTLKSLGKHRHYYVGGESVSYITEGTRKSSSSMSKVKSKSGRFWDSSKQATSAASTARRSEVILKPGETAPDFILLPRDLPVLSRFPSGKGMQKFYVGSSTDTSKGMSTSGLLTNRKGHPWEWDQEWYPKSSMNRSEHRKSLDMLRTTHSQLQMKTVSSFPKELARSDVSMPELNGDGEVERQAESEPLPVPIAVVTEPTPDISEQSVPPPMSASEPINLQQIPMPSNANSGQGQTLERSFSTSQSRMSAAVAKLLAVSRGIQTSSITSRGMTNRTHSRGTPKKTPSRGISNKMLPRGMLNRTPSRGMSSRTPSYGIPTKTSDGIKPAEPIPPPAPEVNSAEPMPGFPAFQGEATPAASKDIYINELVSSTSTEEMSTDRAGTLESSQVVSSQPSQIVGREPFYPAPKSQQRLGWGGRPQATIERENMTQERRTPRPYSPWDPVERSRGPPKKTRTIKPRKHKKRRSRGKRAMQYLPTITTEGTEETQEGTTTEGNTQSLQDGNTAEIGPGTEEPPPQLTPLKFSKQRQPHQRLPISERESRPLTPSRAELYSRYTFKLDHDRVSSKAFTAIPKAKKPWDKGLLVVRSGPRRKSKDIEEIKEKRKSNEDGGDNPPPLHKR